MVLSSALPSGTVTFLFTDIEGSTRLWQDNPDAMYPALIRHDALIRDAIMVQGGSVFKTVGDAFCAAFTVAPDALHAALDAQKAVLSEPWEAGARLIVRIALHTGTAEQRENDYFGPSLNRVSRLLSAAHGGQVLLSAATQELVRDLLPPSAALRDLGQARLKDLGRPERVFQLLHSDLPADFPPLRFLESAPNNLPQHLTSFIGREKEVADIKGLLERVRLLTLTGTGGAGKSRLSLQAATHLLSEMEDGVWFVELAPISDPGLVPQTVADALDVREEPGKRITQTLIDALKSRRLLLVLDNAEHLVAACAGLVGDLLRFCPHVHILVSSREPLGVSGEQTYPIPSLSLPDTRQAQTAQATSQYEAVRLFIERARLVQPGFAVSDANAPAVAQICVQLDGIPLAIELAAARVRAMPVEQIMARLDDRFRLLTGGARTALPRQQTLRALIDWSYNLLNERERAALRALSVFTGGWTLPAAEAICAGETVEDWEVLDLLSSLVDKSLVVYEFSDEDQPRYRLLETVRQYGQDRLRESGEQDGARQRHAAWFLALADQAAPQLRQSDQAAWLRSMESDHDNLRAALDWCLGRDETTETALRLCGSLWRFWEVHGHWTQGRAWFERALNAPGPVTPRWRARALCGAGFLASFQGDYARMAELASEGLALAREIGDSRRAGAASVLLGFAAYAKGDLEQAAEFAEESLRLSREAGDKWQTCAALHLLGRTVLLQGDLERAFALQEECLGLMREIGEEAGLGYALWGLGEARQRQGQADAARGFFAESLLHFQTVAERRGMAHALEGLAKVAVEANLAARLLGAAERLREEVGAAIEPADRIDRDHHAARIHEAMGDADFADAWASGQAMPLDKTIELALAEPV